MLSLIGSAIRSPSNCFALAFPSNAFLLLLEHQSVRVTEKHYNPWVRSRQQQLEADVRNAWKSDPLIIAGTKQVQIPKGPVN